MQLSLIEKETLRKKLFLEMSRSFWQHTGNTNDKLH